jgi:plastocyanin
VNPRLKLALSTSLLLAGSRSVAQGADVTAKFVAPHTSHPRKAALNDIVLWLSPADDSTPARTSPLPKTGYRLVQKDKMFTPHLLVVPAGSSVDFPNEDPFFHNVFSLFNGKRFDLGLYESGTHRAVRFDREGVSYIFCNIHPEMGAIVLALHSPYFALSAADGSVTIHNVPPGKYYVHLWSEQFQSGDPAAPSTTDRIVQVTAQGAALGIIDLTPAPDPLAHHKNKFGEDYPVTPPAKY